MKIQCDVCERAPATVICCADEAALCGKCDVEVHAANKLASKHHRLLLHSLSSNLIPKCDICQDKTALIFCVEDRALFCQDCDEPIHSANSLTANHQRLLATGIKVALMMTSASCTDKTSTSFDPPPPPTALDDLLDHLSDFDHPSDHKQHKDPLDLGGFEWLADMGLLGEPQEALEVPQLRPISPPTNFRSPAKSDAPFKKLRIETPIDDDEFFIVPDLG